ncbi:MAG: hypothetical protein HYZ13_02660 [Acidobacteria bacterium]|nr:hypothetical protein [Acidobacteriota bacterium]
MRTQQEILWMGFTGRSPEEVRTDLRPGGVILFGRNLEPDPASGPAACKALNDGLQARWGVPVSRNVSDRERGPGGLAIDGGERALAIALDQEGGAVSRLRPWVGDTPNLRIIWEEGGASACEAWGRLWGEGLALLGFNVDFAPVADLWDGHAGTGMGDRCASRNPAEVAAAAGAFLHGLEATGVRGCLKHFPGLGGTLLDSHKGLPELTDQARIGENARPFIALSHEDRLVMVAHLKLPATEGLPASLHRGSVIDNPWGVRGRFLPDDLEMGGCTDWDWDARVRLSLAAGHEWLLVCQTEAGVSACAAALERLPSSAWEQALERSRAMRAHLREPRPGALDGAAWSAWVSRVRAAAAALAGV